MSYKPNQDRFKNYILEPKAEFGVGKFVTYADAAGTRPVDGTGGSPTVTIARSTSSPLSGLASFLFTKDAANRQGEGFSYDFLIDESDRAKVHNISFDYNISSGTFVAGSDSTDSDLIVYLYDVTNAQLIEPAPFRLFSNGSGVASFSGSFQSNSNSSSYRLIFHVASTSASAYTLKFDNFSVSREPMINGSLASDWISYTPIFTGFGTSTNIVVYYSRSGDSISVRGRFDPGTTTATEARLGLPSGLSFTTDSGKMAILEMAGDWQTGSQAATYIGKLLCERSATYLTFGFGNGTTSPTTKQNGDNVSTSGNTVYFETKLLPIEGWASQTQASSQSQNRIIIARASKNTGSHTSSGSFQDVASWTTDFDSSASFNSTTGVFTCPESGYYRVSGLVSFDGNVTGIRELVVQKNGSTDVGNFERETGDANGNYMSGSNVVSCVAGDTLRLRAYQNSGGTLGYAASNVYNHVTFQKTQGPLTTLPTETVAMRYTGNPPTGTLTAAFNKITYPTKIYDTNNAYSSGTFTVPVSGKYHISASVGITATYAANNLDAIAAFKNGSIVQQGSERAFATQSDTVPQLSGDIDCFAGDTLEIRGFSDATTPTYQSSVPQLSNVSIHRIG